jgi:hypothetical protein
MKETRKRSISGQLGVWENVCLVGLVVAVFAGVLGVALKPKAVAAEFWFILGIASALLALVGWCRHRGG